MNEKAPDTERSLLVSTLRSCAYRKFNTFKETCLIGNVDYTSKVTSVVGNNDYISKVTYLIGSDDNTSKVYTSLETTLKLWR